MAKRNRKKTVAVWLEYHGTYLGGALMEKCHYWPTDTYYRPVSDKKAAWATHKYLVWGEPKNVAAFLYDMYRQDQDDSRLKGKKFKHKVTIAREDQDAQE